MRWTQAQFNEYQARRNQAGRSPPSSQPEQVVQHDTLAEKPGEGINPARVHVRITSFRRRLIDPDNLCPKYFIDSLRYAGIIPNDREEDIILEVSQVKVKTKAEERTELTIEPT